MTSSQPVKTPNAINFTPDNKHCYAYSGSQTTDGSVWNANTELLNFKTQSEYIIGKFYLTTDMITGNNLFIKIEFNDVTILNLKTDGVPPYANEFRDYELVIPPFTHVKFLFGAQGVTTEATGLLSGKAIGMADVGYQ